MAGGMAFIRGEAARGRQSKVNGPFAWRERAVLTAWTGDYWPSSRHDMRWADRNDGGLMCWNITSPVVPAVTATRMSTPDAELGPLASLKIAMSRPTAPWTSPMPLTGLPPASLSNDSPSENSRTYSVAGSPVRQGLSWGDVPAYATTDSAA